MIPELWNELGTEKIGDLNDCLECFVEEERNGIFELTLDFPNGYPLADQLTKEKIIVANANDTLLNQKFRIYDTKKFMSETITVFARHISFDLMYDYVGDVTFENQSCEYALNSLFRQSQFSKHYRGYSDIVNAQNYSMSMCNILEAIGGKEGSIIDTFGTGAEILRDNTDIHVLNARGHDNGVTIEYGKNLTGFELSEDTTNLITRILPYAKYTPEGGKETVVKGNFVDSPLINNYSHPYIKHIDYSDKFQDKKDAPTKEKLETLASNEYRDNKVDIPKTNFKIEFIPLSKCVGYEGLEDKISICDKVTIKNTRYNVDTKAKVIKYKFDVLKERYERMELGEPRTTLGDVIGSGSGEGQVGPQGPQGPPGVDGNIGDFPNSLPQVPILTVKVYGFSTIELSWTFEDKVYYTYELYSSKTKDFTPNAFDLIHSGQSSSFLFQAKPNETWYFKVCAKNTHGERTEFSPQVIATTKKIDDLSNYVDNVAIGEALIGELSLDRGWVGKLNANYLDVKGNFSVTDGNGKRTLDIDSFGNVDLDAHKIRMASNGEISINTNNFNINNTEMSFIRNGVKTFGIKRGYAHLYNPQDSTLMGASIARSTVGGEFYDNGISTIVSNNGYYYSIAKANDWNSDNDSTFSPNEIFIINFRDRGSSLINKKGVHCLDVLMPSAGINMLSASITNADTITANNLSSLSYRAPSGIELFRTNGYDVYNNVNWDWQGHNILDPVIINGNYGHGVVNNEPSTFTSLFTNIDKSHSLSASNMSDSIFDQINVVKSVPNVFLFRVAESDKVTNYPIDTIGKLDISNVVNKEELLLDNNNADLGKLVTLLFSEVKSLKSEIAKLKGGV